ncbi:MAG: preprotein translocase subunit SecE [bacterium]
MAKAAENNADKNAKQPAKTNRFVAFFQGIGKAFKNMYHELKKVTWPTRKELINYSVVVFVFMIIMGVIIGVIDFAAGELINLIVKL